MQIASVGMTIVQRLLRQRQNASQSDCSGYPAVRSTRSMNEKHGPTKEGLRLIDINTGFCFAPKKHGVEKHEKAESHV